MIIMQMEVDWWHPVYFANTELPIPDGCKLKRVQVELNHDPNTPKPVQFPNLKPSYIWVGSRGQVIPADDLQQIVAVNPYLAITAAEIERLLGWWKVCEFF
jgi:hypothetical protein